MKTVSKKKKNDSKEQETSKPTKIGGTVKKKGTKTQKNKTGEKKIKIKDEKKIKIPKVEEPIPKQYLHPLIQEENFHVLIRDNTFHLTYVQCSSSSSESKKGCLSCDTFRNYFPASQFKNIQYVLPNAKSNWEAHDLFYRFPSDSILKHYQRLKHDAESEKKIKMNTDSFIGNLAPKTETKSKSKKTRDDDEKQSKGGEPEAKKSVDPLKSQKMAKNAVLKKLKKWFQTGESVFHPLPIQQKFLSHFASTKEKISAYHLNKKMGSGKTKVSLAIDSYFPEVKESLPFTIVCTNTLIGQWAKSVGDLPQSPNTFTIFEIMGNSKAESLLRVDEQYFKNRVVALDEAHYYRNLTILMQLAIAGYSFANYLLILTGTPFSNDIQDLRAMLLLLERADESKIEQDLNKPVTLDEIKRKCGGGRTIYYDPKEDPTMKSMYPIESETIVKVPMSWIQTIEYIFSRSKQTKFGNMTLQTSRSNSYDTALKRLCNSYENYSPKFDAVVQNILTLNRWPQAIFSKYIDNGIEGVHKKLQVGIQKQFAKSDEKPVIEIIRGNVSTKERTRILKDYNENGTVHVLGFSEAANVGTDCWGTYALHILDPADNLQDEAQIRGRVSRFRSHIHCVDKSVRIYKYISTFPTQRTTKDIVEMQNHLIRRFFTNCEKVSEDDVKKSKPQKSETWTSLEDEIGMEFNTALDRALEVFQHETVDVKVSLRNQEKQKQMEPFIQTYNDMGTCIPFFQLLMLILVFYDRPFLIGFGSTQQTIFFDFLYFLLNVKRETIHSNSIFLYIIKKI